MTHTLFRENNENFHLFAFRFPVAQAGCVNTFVAKENINFLFCFMLPFFLLQTVDPDLRMKLHTMISRRSLKWAKWHHYFLTNLVELPFTCV